MDNNQLSAEKLQSIFDKVKAIGCFDLQIPVVYGTQKVLNEIKDWLPSDVVTQVLPDTMLPEGGENNVYIIPRWSPNQLLKVSFEDYYEPEVGCWEL